MFAATGVRAIVGTLIVGTVLRRVGVVGTLVITSIGVGLCFLGWALGLISPPLLILPTAEFVIGVCDSVYNVTQVSLRQSVTPDHLQGRMTATLRTILVPHVLFGDLTRWVIGEYRESQGYGPHARDARKLLERTLRFLEERFTDQGDDAAQDLIAVSFLENLHQAGSDYPGPKALLGPRLQAWLGRLEG